MDIRIKNDRGALKAGQLIYKVNYEAGMALIGAGDAELLTDEVKEQPKKTRKPRKKKEE